MSTNNGNSHNCSQLYSTHALGSTAHAFPSSTAHTHSSRAFPSIVSISKSTKNVEARMPSRGHHLQSERQPVGGNCQLVTRQFISRVHKEPQKLNSKNPLKHPIGKGACELHRQQIWWKVCNRGSAPIPDSQWTDGTAHHQRLTVTTEGHTQKQTAQLLPYLNWYI